MGSLFLNIAIQLWMMKKKKKNDTEKTKKQSPGKYAGEKNHVNTRHKALLKIIEKFSDKKDKDA